jgi:hypothetical protein
MHTNDVHPNWRIEISSVIDGGLGVSQHLIASPLVYGFSLEVKEWMVLIVDDLENIEWDEQVFWLLQGPRLVKSMALMISGLVEAG